MNTRNKALIITGCLLLVVALVAFLIGGWLAGWDFGAYFKSSAFVWLCVLVGIYAIGVISLFVYDKIKKL